MVAVVSFLCPWRAVTELLRAVNGFHRLPRRDVELTLSGACRVGMGVEGRNDVNDVNAINHPINHSCHIPFLGGIPNLSQFHTPLMGDGKFIGSDSDWCVWASILHEPPRSDQPGQWETDCPNLSRRKMPSGPLIMNSASMPDTVLSSFHFWRTSKERSIYAQRGVNSTVRMVVVWALTTTSWRIWPGPLNSWSKALRFTAPCHWPFRRSPALSERTQWVNGWEQSVEPWTIQSLWESWICWRCICFFKLLYSQWDVH